VLARRGEHAAAEAGHRAVEHIVTAVEQQIHQHDQQARAAASHHADPRRGRCGRRPGTGDLPQPFAWYVVLFGAVTVFGSVAQRRSVKLRQGILEEAAKEMDRHAQRPPTEGRS